MGYTIHSSGDYSDQTGEYTDEYTDEYTGESQEASPATQLLFTCDRYQLMS